LSHWDPYAVCRGGYLELYYCNMVEWSWWDSSLICKMSFDTVGLFIWPIKIVPEMTCWVKPLHYCFSQLTYTSRDGPKFGKRQWNRLNVYSIWLASIQVFSQTYTDLASLFRHFAVATDVNLKSLCLLLVTV